MVKCTGRGFVVKRPGVLSKVQPLTLVLGVGVFSLPPRKAACKTPMFTFKKARAFQPLVRFLNWTGSVFPLPILFVCFFFFSLFRVLWLTRAVTKSSLMSLCRMVSMGRRSRPASYRILLALPSFPCFYVACGIPCFSPLRGIRLGVFPCFPGISGVR